MEIAPLYHEPRPTDILTEVPREVKSTVELAPGPAGRAARREQVHNRSLASQRRTTVNVTAEMDGKKENFLNRFSTVTSISLQVLKSERPSA